MVLPLPDSPTSPSDSAGPSWSETSFTGRIQPAAVGNSTTRLRTSSKQVTFGMIRRKERSLNFLSQNKCKRVIYEEDGQRPLSKVSKRSYWRLGILERVEALLFVLWLEPGTRKRNRTQVVETSALEFASLCRVFCGCRLSVEVRIRSLSVPLPVCLSCGQCHHVLAEVATAGILPSCSSSCSSARTISAN